MAEEGIPGTSVTAPIQIVTSNAAHGLDDGVQPTMEYSDTKFSDVKGVDEAKAELEHIVHYLRDPKNFTGLGGKLPKGILLVGTQGTGKTMLARAIAGETGVPLFSCSGIRCSETTAGVGARRMKDIFAAAKKSSPCIIFIDDIDVICGFRKLMDQGMTLSHQLTLSRQLLVELDGLEQNKGIIVIAATNFCESLDKALMEPGRFNQEIVVFNPNVEARRQILETHMSSKIQQIGEDVDIMTIARVTLGFSGANLVNLVNIAAFKAATCGAQVVGMADLEYAKDRIVKFPEHKCCIISEKSRKITAYHEAGNALVAIYSYGGRRVRKVTIVPDDKSRGKTSFMHAMNKRSSDRPSRREMLASLDVYMAGRVAEELIFGENEVTSGPCSDLEKATNKVREMVTKYAMSKEVGLVTHNYGGKGMSAETRQVIDKEVKEFLEKAYDNAKTILRTHSREHHALANALLEHETLTGDEILNLLALGQWWWAAAATTTGSGIKLSFNQ